VIEFNPAAERLFGYGRMEILGRPAGELLVPVEGREEYRRVLARMRSAEGSQLLGRRLEITALRRDGTTFPAELTVTISGALAGEQPIVYGWVRDISDRRRAEAQLTYLAYHDALTGLPNRIMVEQELDLALARARRAGGAAALMFVDLDDFKEVNDRLRSVLRDSDVLARQGGDEFLVLLADLQEEPDAGAESVARKLLDALREPFPVAGTTIATGASIGISLYPADADGTEALLRHADAAMYAAKGAGGGRFAFHGGAVGAPRSRGATPPDQRGDPC
jgi:PAS domain S-box-containing protein